MKVGTFNGSAPEADLWHDEAPVAPLTELQKESARAYVKSQKFDDEDEILDKLGLS
jgi:hypothetical protein